MAYSGCKMAEIQKIILVIDDDATMNTIVGAVLKEAGYNVYTATSFKKGLDSAKAINPDLIILDLHLEEEDGGELLNRLRETPRTAHTPILMLSGETKVAEIRRVMHSGADHYLLKPFSPHDLLHRVAKFMSQDE
jgi:DNA-binding response OmpR family regulator